MTTTNDISHLFRTYYIGMYRLAVLMLRDENVARDIVHDVFEALLRSGMTDPTERYLMAAVRNRCLKYIRSLAVRDRMKEVFSAGEEEIADEEWPDEATIELIRSTVANDLTGPCRRVVELRFTSGKSYQEIADILGISKVAVYKHLRRAIEVLRQKLSRNG